MKKLFLIFVFSLLVISCGKDSTSPLIGTWALACENFPDPPEGAPKSENSEIVFKDDNTFVDISKEYINSDCSGAILETFTSNGTYTNDDLKIDLIVKDLLLSLGTAGSVQIYNDQEACGYSDWKLNTPKDVTTCRGEGPNFKQTAGYTISGNKLSVETAGYSATYTKK